MHLTDLSIRRPVSTLMVFVSLVVVGLIATRLVPLEFMPNITFPGAFVQLPYPNSTPKEINENIARPIEEVLATLSGVDRINSNSGEDNAGVIVLFNQGTDINYLLEGLTGAADADKDGLVTVDAAYRYVSTHVPRATGQEQHPVKKGTVEGRLILSITKFSNFKTVMPPPYSCESQVRETFQMPMNF